jgi:hypothetical protein
MDKNTVYFELSQKLNFQEYKNLLAKKRKEGLKKFRNFFYD